MEKEIDKFSIVRMLECEVELLTQKLEEANKVISEGIATCNDCENGFLCRDYERQKQQIESYQAQLQTSVDQMVNRFLMWQLPKDFYPDCSISFDVREDDELNKNKTWPTGTNLLTANQAKEMFLFCLNRN